MPEGFLIKAAIIGPILVLSVVAHEIAHGYAALRQGDDTAQKLGRLTWNPIPHVDPFLTIVLPLVMLWGGGGVLGGAKPVPVDPRNYREYRRGDIIVSLAGVATNLAIALGAAILLPILGLLGGQIPAAADWLGLVQAVLVYAVLLNLVLIVFNLLPIPPLDGSHVLKHLLPPAAAVAYVRLGARFGFLVLLLLVFFGSGFLGALLTPAYAAARRVVGLSGDLILPETAAWLRLLN